MSRLLPGALPDYFVEKLAEADAFGYTTIAENLAISLCRARAPFTFAICGSWGAGKSSLARLLIEKIPAACNDTPVIISFNAWRHKDLRDIQSAFVLSIASQLKSASNTSHLFRAETDAAVLPATDILITSAQKALEASGPWGTFFYELYKNSIKAQKERTNKVDPHGSPELQLQKSFKDIAKILVENKVSPFVIIDELDRCPPPTVVTVMESISWFLKCTDEIENAAMKANGTILDAPNSPFRFILTIDENYVARSFATQYSLPLDEAHRYLGKYLQSKFHFPKRMWETFVKNSITALGMDLYFKNGIGKIPTILDRFLIENPRDARQCLAYLLHWQDRGFSSLIQTHLSALNDEERLIAISIANDFLMSFAAIKVKYPQFVDRIVSSGIFESLASLNPGSHDKLRKRLLSDLAEKQFEAEERSLLDQMCDALFVTRSEVEQTHLKNRQGIAASVDKFMAGMFRY